MDSGAERGEGVSKAEKPERFGKLKFQKTWEFEPPWTQPQSVDLYALGRDGQPKVARGLNINELEAIINAFNKSSIDARGEHISADKSTSAVFNLM
jgi:hypothetical protein